MKKFPACFLLLSIAATGLIALSLAPVAAVETITLAPAVKGHQTTIKLIRESTSSFIECFRKEEEKQKKEHKAFAPRQIGLFDPQKLSSIYNCLSESLKSMLSSAAGTEHAKNGHHESKVVMNPRALNENGEHPVKNWMNSFLYVQVGYGDGEEDFNVIFDSSANLAGQPGNFLVGTCPPGKVMNKYASKMNNQVKIVDRSCRRHKMLLLQPDSKHCERVIQQTSIDGTENNMHVCEYEMRIGQEKTEKVELLLIDGEKFDLFDAIIDAGGPGGPRIDGVFSLALATESNVLKSGAAYLLANKEEQVASVFMESFHNLDFFSGTGGAITFGQKDTKNCQNWGTPLSVIKGSTRWNVPLEVTSQWPGEPDAAMTNQHAMISTFDIFIYAPNSFTDPLFEKLTSVNDNFVFNFLRHIGKLGLIPKGVLITCPTEEELAEMPTIHLKFGNQQFTFGPKDYILPIVLPNLPILGQFRLFNWCHPVIRDRSTAGRPSEYILTANNKNKWILGQLFFNKACVAFDYATNTVSFADAKQKPKEKAEQGMLERGMEEDGSRQLKNGINHHEISHHTNDEHKKKQE